MKKTFTNLREELTHKKLAPMVDSFVDYASKELGIKSMPNINMIQKGEDSRSFGGYMPSENKIMIVTKNRHPMDIFRTLAHEMVHCKQYENGQIGKDIRKEGETGSPQENDANAQAGVLMRNYARMYPNMFDSSYVTEEAEVWDKPNPKKTSEKLSPSEKSKAKARAKKAGRKYPNMIDNMWAARLDEAKRRRKKKDDESTQDDVSMSKTTDTGGMSKVRYPTRRMAEQNTLSEGRPHIKMVHPDKPGQYVSLTHSDTSPKTGHKIVKQLTDGNVRLSNSDVTKHKMLMKVAKQHGWVPAKSMSEDLDNHFELFFENAGEWGTDDLTKTYVRDTPGQKFWKYDELNEEGQLKHHNTQTSNFDICPGAKKAFEKDLENDSLPEDKIHGAIVAVDEYLGLEKQAIKNKSITKREFDSFMSAVKDAKDKIREIGGVSHDYHKVHIDNMRKLINVNEDYAAPMRYGFGNSDGKSGLLPTATRNTPMTTSGFTGAGPSIPMAEEEPVEKKKKKKSIKQIKAENNLDFKTKEQGLPTNKGPDNFVPFTPAGVGSIKEAKTPAWTRKEGQSETGGLNRKGIESYRRENPGSKLSMAVTTKPSKLKKGSKAAKRRKSFCARMGGMKKRLTSAKTARDPNSRINKALRKWNC